MLSRPSVADRRDPRRPGGRRDVDERDPTPIGMRFGTVVRPQRARKHSFFHLGMFPRSCQAKSAPNRRANYFGLELHAQICESRASCRPDGSRTPHSFGSIRKAEPTRGSKCAATMRVEEILSDLALL